MLPVGSAGQAMPRIRARYQPYLRKSKLRFMSCARAATSPSCKATLQHTSPSHSASHMFATSTPCEQLWLQRHPLASCCTSTHESCKLTNAEGQTHLPCSAHCATYRRPSTSTGSHASNMHGCHAAQSPWMRIVASAHPISSTPPACPNLYTEPPAACLPSQRLATQPLLLVNPSPPQHHGSSYAQTHPPALLYTLCHLLHALHHCRVPRQPPLLDCAVHPATV